MRIRFAGAALVALLAIAGPASSAMTHRAIGLTATVFTVDSTADSVDAVPGDGACADSGGACTLRAATQEAAATAGSVQITVPAGTYALGIANPAAPCCSVPAIAFDPATGDLDVAGTVSIVGAGVGQSIVSAAFL
ncbi:MAG TPA: hypothetical protein VMJ49_10095, partial [Gaiellaceae bacterium]|nr:hypothetical protein [Gaiellaceae bacterium]